MKRTQYEFSQRQKDMIRRMEKLGIGLFFLVMIFGTILGLMMNHRPVHSDTEKRDLTEFPKLTLESFLDGSYFTQIAVWYSDTFPMRDQLMDADEHLERLYGISGSSQFYGGNAQGDEIPTFAEVSTGDLPGSSEPGSGSSAPTIILPNSSETQPVTPETAPEPEPEPEPQPAEPVELPDSHGMDAEIQKQIQKGLYVKNGAAYSVYYFIQEHAENYMAALNQAAEKLKGVANVYSILVPNNSGAMLPDDELEKLGGSNQRQGIAYQYSLCKGTIPVPTYDTIREHNNEYLYFRTDHHWTQLGAYYVYRSFCEVKGIQPHELSDFQTMTFYPFLGTFYDSIRDPAMEANPDTVTAYIPNGTNQMTYWDEEGVEHPWHVITDVSNWNKGSGYYCYIGGDRPMSIIENPQIQDGSSCLVVKESYGNCFVPFLVDHYQTVYVVDFRYAQVNVVDYIKEHGIQDLIVINNITIAATKGIAGRLATLF